MGDKYLVLNADDFGMCSAYNQAVFHLLEENKITSTTLMPVTPGFEEAASWCRKHEVLCVGLHTTFTSEWASYRWGSLTREPSLEDEEGYLYPTVEDFCRHADRGAVERELEAQFKRFQDTGLFFSHVDNHMGSLYPYPGHPETGYLKEIFRLCDRYGKLPFRMFRIAQFDDGERISASSAEEDLKEADKRGIALIDYLHSYPFHPREGETYDSLKKDVIGWLYAMPEGLNELYFHPSVDCGEVRSICPVWQRRVWEFQMLMDPDFSYAVRDARLKLIHYQDVKRLRA